MKFGEQDMESDYDYTGGAESSNPFDDFTNQYKREHTPVEEMGNPETSDFSNELARQEKDKIRNIGVTPDPKKWGTLIKSVRGNIRTLEHHLRKLDDMKHKLPASKYENALWWAQEDLKNNKKALELLENNDSLPVSAMKKLFIENGLPHLARYKWA